MFGNRGILAIYEILIQFCGGKTYFVGIFACWDRWVVGGILVLLVQVTGHQNMCFFVVGGIHTCWKYRVHIYVGFGEIINTLPMWSFKWILCMYIVLCVERCIINEMPLTRPLFFLHLWCLLVLLWCYMFLPFKLWSWLIDYVIFYSP